MEIELDVLQKEENSLNEMLKEKEISWQKHKMLKSLRN